MLLLPLATLAIYLLSPKFRVERALLALLVLAAVNAVGLSVLAVTPPEPLYLQA
ncbi:MAG: hypothetical protein HY784_03925, partial [Chloroflexi bacterium]|nr:hypothetical protein [Chloroflexota bacterium]